MKFNKKDGPKVVGAALVALVVILGGWWLLQSNNSLPGQEGSANNPSQNSGTGTVASIVAGIENGVRFNQLLSQSGVLSSISGKGPYTVFVSTDGAFGRLVPGTINNMSASELKRTMQYHIVGKSLDIDVLNNSQIQALSKDTLNFRVDAARTSYVNSGQVLHSYKASNGMVYVINAVLVPPTKTQ